MHIIPENGDVGLYGANIPFLLFRPSLRNIASLGTPVEIIALFESVMGESTQLQMVDAMGVLWACCETPDAAHEAIGYLGEGDAVLGKMEPVHKIHIARHLMLHGMVGDVEIVPDNKTTGPIKEFKASNFAALAIAHLGMSQADAWDMSMTALITALNAKFPSVLNPEREGAKDAPTPDEHDATMAWFESIRG